MLLSIARYALMGSKVCFNRQQGMLLLAARYVFIGNKVCFMGTNVWFYLPQKPGLGQF